MRIFLLSICITAFFACNKETCSECHYDAPSGEIELGEKCGTDLEELEKNGYTVSGQTYTVHCGEEH